MPEHTNGQTNGMPVLEKVRAALADAEVDGRRRPGRPALVTLTGASAHQVRRALAALDAASGLTGGRQPSRQPRRRRPPAGKSASKPTSAAANGSAGDLQRALAGDQLAPAPGTLPAHQPSTSVAASPASGAVPGARLVAWAGFVFGSLMSIAANVLHTWLPAADMPAGWTPGIAPQVGAAVWPVALLLSVEVLSRVQWPRIQGRHGWGWGLARYGGAGTVALGSAVISYDHLKAVLLAWGYSHPGADVGPLVLDGLMVVSGFALLAMSQTATDRRP